LSHTLFRTIEYTVTKPVKFMCCSYGVLVTVAVTGKVGEWPSVTGNVWRVTFRDW